MQIKTVLTAATLVLAATAPAFAAEGFRPLIGAELTGGGKTLVEVEFEGDRPNQKISSGGLTHLFGGVEYRDPNGRFAIQTTIGYHFDRVDAKNASLSFSRVPLEVLGFWNANERIRLGGGLRKAFNSSFETSGDASDDFADFNMRSSIGFVLQGEYLFGEHTSVFLRYVDESYKSNRLVGGKVDGNHGGLGVSYRF
ncbi:MAG TPA: outer membrane beta-barrel protein [Ideonella sp.]|uniref:outer membrane beta-barrel protein n=1 Tax=Ideonella sp. TaxID=1929293 RepID=UPI002E325EEB|nr:outer membrane beta-barrel protein [Ideonella sp.]HEX5687287.1 outer membrane beta-barrel protein [Ideonella sp.]